VSRRALDIARRPFPFVLRVLRGFWDNRGLLLAGAVAYNSLLSIVPLFALLLLGLSLVVPPDQLATTVEAHLELIIPADSTDVAHQLEALVQDREIVSGIVVVMLLFFSSIAFGVLESAMAAIFHHREKKRRRFLVSAALPYLFIGMIGIGVLVVSFVAGALDNVETDAVLLFGTTWSMEGVSGVILYILGVLGLILMLTAFYLVMPVGKIRVPHALLGGVVAGILWEIARHVLIWYFQTLSLVNLVYGSLAGAVVALLSFEIGAIILLLGAQVIAEFDRHEVETEPAE
jgi:YihY family inner membrane protein